MKYIRIGNIVIRTAKSVKEKLKDHYIGRKAYPDQFYTVFGAYQSRILGLCIYRTMASDKKAMDKIEAWFQEDVARAEEMIRNYPECLDVTDEDRERYKKMVAGFKKREYA